MKLAIIPIICGAFKFFWLNRHQFYYLAFPVITILAIFSTLLTLLFPDNPSYAPEFKFLDQQNFIIRETYFSSYDDLSWIFFGDLFLFILIIFFIPLYSVAWHRFFLVPEEDINVLGCYNWRKRHSLFLWLNLKIFLLMIPISGFAVLLIIASTIFFPIVALAMIFFLTICYCRFSLWLPAAALDKKLDLRDTFALTRGNGVRLALILIITGILAGILDSIAISLITYASDPLSAIGRLTQNLLTNIALYSILYAGKAIGITALSISYKQLTESCDS